MKPEGCRRTPDAFQILNCFLFALRIGDGKINGWIVPMFSKVSWDNVWSLKIISTSSSNSFFFKTFSLQSQLSTLHLRKILSCFIREETHIRKGLFLQHVPQTSPASLYAAFEHKDSLLLSVQWISVAVIISPLGRVSVALSTTTETQKTPFPFVKRPMSRISCSLTWG